MVFKFYRINYCTKSNAMCAPSVHFPFWDILFIHAYQKLLLFGDLVFRYKLIINVTAWRFFLLKTVEKVNIWTRNEHWHEKDFEQLTKHYYWINHVQLLNDFRYIKYPTTCIQPTDPSLEDPCKNKKDLQNSTLLTKKYIFIYFLKSTFKKNQWNLSICFRFFLGELPKREP